MAVVTQKTFCRFCHANCAIEVDLEDGVPVAVRGDVTDPEYGGYTCIKGRQLPGQYTYPDRVSRLVAIEGLGPPPSRVSQNARGQRER